MAVRPRALGDPSGEPRAALRDTERSRVTFDFGERPADAGSLRGACPSPPPCSGPHKRAGTSCPSGISRLAARPGVAGLRFGVATGFAGSLRGGTPRLPPPPARSRGPVRAALRASRASRFALAWPGSPFGVATGSRRLAARGAPLASPFSRPAEADRYGAPSGRPGVRRLSGSAGGLAPARGGSLALPVRACAQPLCEGA